MYGSLRNLSVLSVGPTAASVRSVRSFSSSFTRPRGKRMHLLAE